MWFAIAAWLLPSAVAACSGAMVAGVVDGIAAGSALGGGAAIGFIAIMAVPALFAVSTVTRLLWLSWRPHVRSLVEPDRSAPRLVGWLAAVGVGAAMVGFAVHHGTWLLANFTAFKPETLAFAEPALAIVAALAMLVVSRPLSDGVTAVTRMLDRRWRARDPGRAPLVTMRNIVACSALGLVATVGVVWLVLHSYIGAFDLAVLYAPAAGLAAFALAHGGWMRLSPAPRRIASYGLFLIVAISVGCALVVWREFPSRMLAMWGDCPLAGSAIDRMVDVNQVRARVPSREFRPAEQAGASHPDIVLITIDTVRADHTPPYGGNAAMPVLRELASRGAVFDWAFSPSNVTRRSIPSMIIGLGPDRIRGRVVGWALRLDPRYVVLAERLRAGGYDTAGFMCCEGFWGHKMRTGLERGLTHLEIEPNGTALARRARSWLAQREKTPHRAPLFLWLHILEPHNWAAGGQPHTDAERNKQYDRTLATTDAMLGDVLAALSDRRPDNAPIVIVTADHGESLGDHGQPFHSTDLYNSQIRVPLIVVGPSIKPGRIAQTVSLIGLTPSILELAGFQVAPGPAIENYGFADLATGKQVPDPNGGTAFAAMIRDRSNPGGVTAIIRGPWKLIETPKGFELYDTRQDPSERSNQLATRPQQAEELRRALTEHRRLATKSPFE